MHEPRLFGAYITGAQAEKDDTCVRLLFLEYKLPKITIVSDDCALLSKRCQEDVAVGHRSRIVACDDGHIMALRTQKDRESVLRIFIEQEPHPQSAAVASVMTVGKISSPATSAAA